METIGNANHALFDGLAILPLNPPGQEFIAVRGQLCTVWDNLAFLPGEIVTFGKLQQRADATR